ncbi:MAG: hypothetical protein LBM98_12255 [Oscillospiraceae bacterium]|nr:hypothetical protein [Oscillospiraceae bacterium]
MLRTCNVLRIASVPVLRKDGAPERRTTRTARRRGFGRGYWAWIASRGSQ